METLLSRARAADPGPKRQTPNADRARLAVAWASDEITLKQACTAFDRRGAAMYAQLASGLRDAFRLGLIRRATAKKDAA